MNETETVIWYLESLIEMLKKDYTVTCFEHRDIPNFIEYDYGWGGPKKKILKDRIFDIEICTIYNKYLYDDAKEIESMPGGIGI